MTDFPFQSEAALESVPRRAFLRVAGATAATVGLVLAGCGKDDPTPVTTPTKLSFGTDTDTDKRVLNYLFFIKQLEFAFYDKVVSAFPADLPTAEQAFFRDLRDHELVQRQVLANVLGSGALPPLPFDFTSVTLTTRAGVLNAAKQLEDTAAGAFLGILSAMNNASLFTLAAKMASVEARHAALVRDMQTPGSFADDDVVTGGQAIARTPTEVKVILAPFLPTLEINIDSLPTT